MKIIKLVILIQPIGKVCRGKKEETQINNQEGSGSIITKCTDIKKIIRGYYEKL